MELCSVNILRTSNKNHFFCASDSLSEIVRSWFVFIFVFSDYSSVNSLFEITRMPIEKLL